MTEIGYEGNVYVDPSWLELALDAMVENALKFTVSGDTIRLSCLATYQGVRFEVADSGPGIPEAVGDAVFERFWHRPPPDGSSGTGLGLALVRATAEAHEGTVAVSRAPEGGALFRLTLPSTTSPEAARAARQVAPS